uniref:Methyl methanesulfonate-sensitivity protein 22-like n=1 Tax=Tetranychus urticae TaxID=32264 RepID=T1JQ52_TETUR
MDSDTISTTPSITSILKMAEDKIKLFAEESDGDSAGGLELLDQKITINESTCEEDLVHYFNLVKKAINIFKVAITAKRSSANMTLWIHYRSQIFNFLKCVYKINKQGNETFQQISIREMTNLVRFTGRISMLDDFDPNIYILSSDIQSPSRQYLHACFDVWLISFHLLCEYNQQTRGKIEILGEVNDPADSRIKFLECLLADLLYISLQKFSSTKDMRMLTTIDPYVCTCHRVLFTIIKILVEKDPAILNIHPFWFYFNVIIDNFIEENRKECKDRDSLITYKRVPSNFNSLDNLNIANLWLMSNLLELIGAPKDSITSQDSCNSTGFTQAIISVLRDFQESSFVKSELLEIAMQLCFNAVKRCSVCVDIPVPFVDYYMKMLTSSQSSSSVYYTLPKSSNQWSLKLRTLFERGSASEMDDKLLDLLLLLLEKVIFKLFAKNSYQNIQLWQKLKSDLFTTLSKYPVEELNESQLYKVLTILIVCCYASDDHYVDIVDKFAELAKAIKIKSSHSKKVKLMIQSTICAALLLSDEKDMNKLVLIAIDIFDRLAEEIIYVSEVKVESIGKCALIPQSIVKVFGQLADRDLLNLVASVTRVINSVRIYLPMVLDASNQHSFGIFLANIMKNFLPFVKAQYGKGSIIQIDVCEVASNLTFLSYFKDSGKLNPSEFRNNFFLFTCSSRIDNKQREKFCDLLFESGESLLTKEVCQLLAELTERFLKSDDSGQTRIKTVIQKLIVIVIKNVPNHISDYFEPKLTEIISRNLVGPNMIKLFRLLMIFIKFLPEVKPKLVTTIAQRIHEIELEGKQSTNDIRDALRNFFHGNSLK